MAVIVAILGSSGDGKTTSTIINPDGTFNLENYQGMNPKSHFILNLDRKALPFPAGMWGTEQHNYAETSEFTAPKGAPANQWGIKQWLEYVAKQESIKSISIDTVNIYLSMKEFNDRKKMTFDQWRDVATA